MQTPSQLVALSTKTFDVQYLLQILDYNGNVLVTVGEPTGPGGEPTCFMIWDGEGEDEEETLHCTISNVLGDTNAAWRGAVQEAYKRAVQRVLIAIPTDSDITKTSIFITSPG